MHPGDKPTWTRRHDIEIGRFVRNRLDSFKIIDLTEFFAGSKPEAKAELHSTQVKSQPNPRGLKQKLGGSNLDPPASAGRIWMRRPLQIACAAASTGSGQFEHAEGHALCQRIRARRQKPKHNDTSGRTADLSGEPTHPRAGTGIADANERDACQRRPNFVGGRPLWGCRSGECGGISRV